VEAQVIHIRKLHPEGRPLIRFEGGRRAAPRVRTVTLPKPRKVRELGVLGEYEGYETELRSVFSEYRLQFGRELERNIVVSPGRMPTKISHNGNIVLEGDIDRLLPLCLDFKHYLRTPIVFKHEAIVLGGIKLSR